MQDIFFAFVDGKGKDKDNCALDGEEIKYITDMKVCNGQNLISTCSFSYDMEFQINNKSRSQFIKIVKDRFKIGSKVIFLSNPYENYGDLGLVVFEGEVVGYEVEFVTAPNASAKKRYVFTVSCVSELSHLQHNNMPRSFLGLDSKEGEDTKVPSLLPRDLSDIITSIFFESKDGGEPEDIYKTGFDSKNFISFAKDYTGEGGIYKFGKKFEYKSGGRTAFEFLLSICEKYGIRFYPNMTKYVNDYDCDGLILDVTDSGKVSGQDKEAHNNLRIVFSGVGTGSEEEDDDGKGSGSDSNKKAKAADTSLKNWSNISVSTKSFPFYAFSNQFQTGFVSQSDESAEGARIGILNVSAGIDLSNLGIRDEDFTKDTNHYATIGSCNSIAEAKAVAFGKYRKAIEEHFVLTAQKTYNIKEKIDLQMLRVGNTFVFDGLKYVITHSMLTFKGGSYLLQFRATLYVEVRDNIDTPEFAYGTLGEVKAKSFKS